MSKRRFLTVTALFVILALAFTPSASACERCTWRFVCQWLVDCWVVDVCQPGALTTFDDCYVDSAGCHNRGNRCLLA